MEITFTLTDIESLKRELTRLLPTLNLPIALKQWPADSGGIPTPP